jgi:uncharacterized protein YegP (UPF0339 family)
MAFKVKAAPPSPRIDVNGSDGGRWHWSLNSGDRVIAMSGQTYKNKAACCKALYEAQDKLMHALVYHNGKEM